MPPAAAWETVARGAGLPGARKGSHVDSPAGAPLIRGAVERQLENGIVVRTEEPAPGLLEVVAFDLKGPTHVFVRGYLYGEDGPEAVAREEPVWREWLAERLPAVEAPTAKAG